MPFAHIPDRTKTFEAIITNDGKDVTTTTAECTDCVVTTTTMQD